MEHFKKENKNPFWSLLILRVAPLGSRCDHVGIANPMFFYRTKNPIMIYSRGIKFAVGVGTVLLCDYNRGGFQPPQMVKLRPAVVISPRLPYRDGHESERQVDYVARVEFPQPLPYPFPYKYFGSSAI